jgi:hypothetical protein
MEAANGKYEEAVKDAYAGKFDAHPGLFQPAKKDGKPITKEEDLEDFVRSSNEIRRNKHTKSQEACVAAGFALLRPGQSASEDTKTHKALARQHGISTSYIKDARRLKEKAPQTFSIVRDGIAKVETAQEDGVAEADQEQSTKPILTLTQAVLILRHLPPKDMAALETAIPNQVGNIDRLEALCKSRLKKAKDAIAEKARKKEAEQAAVSEDADKAQETSDAASAVGADEVEDEVPATGHGDTAGEADTGGEDQGDLERGGDEDTTSEPVAKAEPVGIDTMSKLPEFVICALAYAEKFSSAAHPAQYAAFCEFVKEFEAGVHLTQSKWRSYATEFCVKMEMDEQAQNHMKR